MFDCFQNLINENYILVYSKGNKLMTLSFTWWKKQMYVYNESKYVYL